MKRLFFIFVLFYFNTSVFSQNVLLEQQKSNIIYGFYDNIFTFGIDTCGLGKLFFKSNVGTIKKNDSQIQWNIKRNYGNASLTIGYVDNNEDSIVLERREFLVRRLPEMKIVIDRRVYPDHFRGDLHSRLKYLKEVKAIIPTIADTFDIIHFDFLIKYEDEEAPMLYNNWGNQVNKGIRDILTGSKKIDAIVLTNFSVEKNGKYSAYLNYYEPNGRLYFASSKTNRKTYTTFFNLLEEEALFYSIFNAKPIGQTSIVDTIDIELKSYYRNFNNYLEDSTVVISTKTSKLYEIAYFNKYALIKSYYENGELRQKGFIEQDCGRKELQYLSLNPETFKEEMYYFELLHKKGEWQTYNEEGELIYKRYYDCGELIREEKIPKK